MTDIEHIRRQAREILETFGSHLGALSLNVQQHVDKNEKGVRNEMGGATGDVDFRTRMFKNAPHADEECLIVEKGNWT